MLSICMIIKQQLHEENEHSLHTDPNTVSTDINGICHGLKLVLRFMFLSSVHDELRMLPIARRSPEAWCYSRVAGIG